MGYADHNVIQHDFGFRASSVPPSRRKPRSMRCWYRLARPGSWGKGLCAITQSTACPIGNRGFRECRHSGKAVRLESIAG
jgi:hypothetical protein